MTEVAAANKDVPRVTQNKKAYHDFFVLETYEAGIALFGTEVKSIRKGRVNLKDSWCNIVGGEIFANGMHISPYEQGNIFNRDPMRPKKLLMHKREIARLYAEVKQQGLTLIPAKPRPKRTRSGISTAQPGQSFEIWGRKDFDGDPEV